MAAKPTVATLAEQQAAQEQQVAGLSDEVKSLTKSMREGFEEVARILARGQQAAPEEPEDEPKARGKTSKAKAAPKGLTAEQRERIESLPDRYVHKPKAAFAAEAVEVFLSAIDSGASLDEAADEAAIVDESEHGLRPEVASSVIRTIRNGGSKLPLEWQQKSAKPKRRRRRSKTA